jgi:hypothetical protein
LADELADLAIAELLESDGNLLDWAAPPGAIRAKIRDWEMSQPWYDVSKNRYQLAMEHALLAPGVRATFLRKHIAKARPSRGYRRLAQLLKSRVFDTIYTTNFDELVRRGCEGALEQPLVEVAAPDAFEGQNPSPCDPRLIRLHGDYHHGNVLNTEGELEHTPGLRFDAVHRLSRPQGMIVIGYGGLDKKLMTQLFDARIHDKNFLKNGLFWCIRSGSEIPPHVNVLIDHDLEGRVHVVEIDGFDQAMELLARGFGLDADKWFLTESLRSSIETQALLADATQLLVDSRDERQPLSERIGDVFRRLILRLRGTEAILLALGSGDPRIIGTVNMSKDTRVAPSSLFCRLPEGQRYDVTAKDLEPDDLFGSIVENRRIKAYQVWRDGLRKGVAVLALEKSTEGAEEDDRIVSSVCGLLVLAADRLYSTSGYTTAASQSFEKAKVDAEVLSADENLSEHEQVSRLAYEFWQARGCVEGFEREDWLRALAEVRKRS